MLALIVMGVEAYALAPTLAVSVSMTFGVAVMWRRSVVIRREVAEYNRRNALAATGEPEDEPRPKLTMRAHQALMSRIGIAVQHEPNQKARQLRAFKRWSNTPLLVSFVLLVLATPYMSIADSDLYVYLMILLSSSAAFTVFLTKYATNIVSEARNNKIRLSGAEYAQAYLPAWMVCWLFDMNDRLFHSSEERNPEK